MDCSYNNDLCGRSNGYFFGIHYKAYFDAFKTYEKAQTGDMTVRFENHYKGEIGQLGDSFNAMVEKINELLGVVYKNRKIKRSRA